MSDVTNVSEVYGMDVYPECERKEAEELNDTEIIIEEAKVVPTANTPFAGFKFHIKDEEDSLWFGTYSNVIVDQVQKMIKKDKFPYIGKFTVNKGESGYNYYSIEDPKDKD